MKATARQEALLKRTFLDFRQMSDFLKEPVIFQKAEGLYYWDQDGKFLPQDVPPASANYIPGSDQFWLVDAALSYRLPKRYGFITVGVTNLSDEEFKYFDTNPTNPVIQPDRFIFGKITIAIP